MDYGVELSSPLCSSLGRACLPVENFLPDVQVHGLSLSPYEIGRHLPDQVVQSPGIDTLLDQDDFNGSRVPLSTDSNPTTAIILPPYLPIPDRTNELHAQQTAPPPGRRKRKAPTLSHDEWEVVKGRIIELHITQGLPLSEVKQSIEGEYGFTATLVHLCFPILIA